MGLVELTGEWEFYWKQFLYPEDFQLEAYLPNKEYLHVPRLWNSGHDGVPFSEQGYATYRLIIIDPTDEPRSIKIPAIRTAYDLWINGELKISNGIVSDNPTEAVPSGTPQVIIFNPRQDYNEIIFHVANFNHKKGGILESIFYGDVRQIHSLENQKQRIEAFLFGILLIIGLYNVKLYQIRRKESAPLFFGLICLLLGFRIVLLGETLLAHWIPELSWDNLIRMEYLTMFLSLPLFVLFIQSLYPKETNEVVNKISITIPVVISTGVLFPPRIFTQTVTFFQAFIGITSIYLFYCVIKAVIRNREGALVTIFGGIYLVLGVFIDIAYFNGIFFTGQVLQGYAYSIGLAIFIFAQSSVLSARAWAAFNQAEQLAVQNAAMIEEITRMNKNLEEKIAARTMELNLTIEKLNSELIQRMRAEEELKQFATIDSMTGMLNRSAGIDILGRQLRLARRNKWYLTICFLDIDDLKLANDQKGHLFGDMIITTVSGAIKDSIRSSDTVCRLGGDEFLIIFPQCRMLQAREILDRIVLKIETINIKQDYKIRISYGFSEVSPEDNTAVDEVIEIADKEMYKTKKLAKAARVSAKV
jgi:diguanylate cyclase (GGDEF)-like protein